jgi:dipeptide transport system substrate-binding protein
MKAAGTPEVIDREPIGTGPFQFGSYQKDAVIRYKAFDAYWGGRPKIDNLVYAITPDASVRYAKLKTGECHVMAFPKPADLALMKDDPNITVLTKEGLNVGYISMNVERKPFDDKLVRQALNMSVDKASILNSVFQGAGRGAKNPIPPTLWSYNDKIKDYPHDIAKAKAMAIWLDTVTQIDVANAYLNGAQAMLDGTKTAAQVVADIQAAAAKAKTEQ